MGSEPNLSVKGSVAIGTMINFDGDNDGDGDGHSTCKLTTHMRNVWSIWPENWKGGGGESTPHFVNIFKTLKTIKNHVSLIKFMKLIYGDIYFIPLRTSAAYQ